MDAALGSETGMPTEIILRFTYTEADYMAAARLCYTRVRNLRVKADTIVGFAATIAGAVATLVLGPDPEWTVLMCVGAALLLIVFMALFVIPHIAFHREPKFRGEYLLKFTESGIEFKTTGIDSKLEWSFYNRLIEDADTFLLIYGKSAFAAIPKRVFADKDEEEAFRALVASKMPTAR